MEAAPVGLTLHVDAQGRALKLTGRDGRSVPYVTRMQDGDDDDVGKLSEEQFPMRHQARLAARMDLRLGAPATPASRARYTCAFCKHTTSRLEDPVTGKPLMFECDGCQGHYLCSPLCQADDWERKQHKLQCHGASVKK